MKGIAKGMGTIFGRMVKPAITECYPDVKRALPERARMSFGMALEADGAPKCRACLLCERSCPDEAIKLESEKREDGPGRVLTKFTIDLGRCMYCGLCVEQCPSDGLHHTGDFETSSPRREDMLLVLYDASASAPSAKTPLDTPTSTELAEVTDASGALPVDGEAGAA